MRATLADGWDRYGDWDGFDPAWIEHRRELARVLNTKDFLVLSSTVMGIASLGEIRAEDLTTTSPTLRAPLSEQGREQLVVYDPYVQRALRIVHGASFTKLDKSGEKRNAGSDLSTVTP